MSLIEKQAGSWTGILEILEKSEKSRAQNRVERVSSYIEARRSAWAKHLTRF
jgi:hypothetical protein